MQFFIKKKLLLLFFITPTLIAQNTHAQNTSVIPYSGTLFSQGKPVSQDTDVLMAFALYSGDAVTALPAGSTNEAPDVALAEESPSYNRLWTSWMTEDGTTSELSSLTVNNPHTVGVNVRNGRFLVHLGAGDQTSLPNSVFDQRPLYVVTWVVNGSGVFRLPPQKLEKVPHAVTAERANSFEVMGDLTVDSITPRGSTLEIEGGINTTGLSTLSGPALNVTGDLNVSGITRLNSRRGNLGTKPSDGNWHTVVSGLHGTHVYELVVRASKGACHGIGHFIAAHTYGNFTVQATSLHWEGGSSACGVEVRFFGTTYDMSLQIRTKGNYSVLGNNSDSPPLYYSVSRLRFD